MFEPKCDWWRKIKWEDKTVLLKGILSIKRKDYGRFVELALDAGMREALAGDYDEESQSGEFWFDAEKEGPRGILNWLGFSVEDETEDGIDFVFFEDSGIAAYRMTWAVPSSRPAPPSSGRVRSSCSWRTGTRQRRRTRASGATRSMARRCTSKMVASSSTRWQEGHPRGCPLPMEGCVCDMCRFLLYYIDSIVGCYN